MLDVLSAVRHRAQFPCIVVHTSRAFQSRCAHKAPAAHAPVAHVAADLFAVLPCGCRLTYYDSSTSFALTCRNRALHGACGVKRTVKASMNHSMARQGRPLGFLLAWAGRCGSASKHVHMTSAIAYDERCAARRAWEASGHVMVERFKNLERPMRDGEGPEPM